MNYMAIVFVLLIFVASFCFWYFSYRHWHLGEGMVLAWNKDDGTVWVASRLVDSPSGRAGVENRSRVLSRNDQKALFATGEEFLMWSKGNKGKKATWEFEGGLVVELVPETIKTVIPVYWVPGESFRMECEKRDRSDLLRKRVNLCGKTGQYVPLYSPSDLAIKRLYL